MSNKNNNWKRNLLLIATAVVGTAATASAQQVKLSANIPFAFSINRGANLPAGSYFVARQGDVWSIYSADKAHATFIVNSIRHPGEATEKPSLSFNCVRGNCEVRSVHLGGGATGIDVPGRKLSKSDAEELAVVSVPLEPNRSE